MAVPITSAMSVAMMAISASRPQRVGGPARVGVAAGLREIAPRGDGEPRAQRLQHDRHDVGDERDDQQRVAELGAAGERGGPVAGVHVADGHEIAGPEEGREPARAGGALDADGAVHVGERRLAPRPAPAAALLRGIDGRPPDRLVSACTSPRPRRSPISGAGDYCFCKSFASKENARRGGRPGMSSDCRRGCFQAWRWRLRCVPGLAEAGRWRMTLPRRDCQPATLHRAVKIERAMAVLRPRRFLDHALGRPGLRPCWTDERTRSPSDRPIVRPRRRPLSAFRPISLAP